MSSPVPVNDITKMSIRFAVKWTISVRELRYIYTKGENALLRSNSYQFGNINGLIFWYILLYDKGYTMKVKNTSNLSLRQDDALVLIKDRIYRVECNPTNTLGQLVCSPNELREDSFGDPEVTIHCIMSIPTAVEAVIPYPDGRKKVVNIVECTLIYPPTYPDEYDAVSEFEYSGKIPDFNVKMAVSMIGVAHNRQDPILKALCSEYLMKNLTSENVAQVLKQSIDFDAKQLSQRCLDFLSEQCKIISIS